MLKKRIHSPYSVIQNSNLNLRLARQSTNKIHELVKTASNSLYESIFNMAIVIRRELPGDSEVISSILKSAFQGSSESHLVDQLRINQATELSWVAELDGEVVAQVLYTPSQINFPANSSEDLPILKGLGLAPLSVVPKYQNQGIGRLLMEESLKELENIEHDFIIVLGHPEFYKKFGFTLAVEYNVRCEFEGIPAEAIQEAFLILWKKVPLPNFKEGLARYREEFYES